MQNAYWYLLKKTYQYLGEYRTQFTLHIFAHTFAYGIRIFYPFLFGMILNTIQEGGTDVMRQITIYLICMLGIEVVFNFFHHWVWEVLETRAWFHA